MLDTEFLLIFIINILKSTEYLCIIRFFFFIITDINITTIY